MFQVKKAHISTMRVHLLETAVYLLEWNRKNNEMLYF